MTSLKGEVALLGEGLAHWANKQVQVVAYIHGVDLTWQGMLTVKAILAHSSPLNYHPQLWLAAQRTPRAIEVCRN